MMRKNIKTGLIAFGMCLALPFCSFAAVKNPEKAEGREEHRSTLSLPLTAKSWIPTQKNSLILSARRRHLSTK